MPTLKTKKILIIEDEPSIAEMYAVRLKQKGFQAIIAADGKTGLAYADETKPDIILLDILLPKVNGFKVLEKLKASEKTKKIPVMVLTNLGHKQDKAEAIKLGAKEYLIKALNTPDQIVKKVAELTA